jgi:rubrerythrin
MFRQIAEEELEHHERLKQLHETWVNEDKWPETIPLTVQETNVRNILVDVIKKVENLPKGNADDLEAIRTALDFEARGARFYADLHDAVSDPKEKKFFELLASIENEHYLSLKDTEEFLVDPAQWYRKHERSGLDGA